ncbi:MAG: hypothetical protein ACRD28_00740 [Acidobacteriaceae bacterium]
MFKELAPLLRQRSVLLTVTHIEEDQLRINIVPKKIADGGGGEFILSVETGTISHESYYIVIEKSYNDSETY